VSSFRDATGAAVFFSCRRPPLVSPHLPPFLALPPLRHSVRRSYQRGIYQPETFKRESKYGLTVLTTTDEGLLRYLKQVSGHTGRATVAAPARPRPRKLFPFDILTSLDNKTNDCGQVMSQMSQWLTQDSVQRLVVVVSGVDSGETLERWQVRGDFGKEKGLDLREQEGV